MMHRYLWAGILGLCAAHASAATFSYDYIEGGVGEVDQGDSFFLGASKSVAPNIYILGKAYAVDSGIDIPGYDGKGFFLEGGLGYAMPFSPKVDTFADAQVLYTNLDLPGDDSDLGYVARLGARYQPMNRIELEGAVAYTNNHLLPNDGVGFTADARYQFTPMLSAGIGYAQDTELDGAFLNVRYHFR